MTSSTFLRRAALNVRRPADVLFFSPLRWDFVFQRPQHVAYRFARGHRVVYWEEPLRDAQAAYLEVKDRVGVEVVVPHLVPDDPDEVETLRRMLDGFVSFAGIHQPLAWYWSSSMRPYSDHLDVSAVVWDCLDESVAPELLPDEAALLAHADVVFTGSAGLYESRRRHHPNVHLLPGSVDVAHFGAARCQPRDPDDQARLSRPRLGWFGVVDRRTDPTLLDALAQRRPEWQFVLIGPVVETPPGGLPRRRNIHWLGARSYADLPRYVAHWDVGIVPFTRPGPLGFPGTRVREYLAAGKPVVSADPCDEIPGDDGLVAIAEHPEAFEAAVDRVLAEDPGRETADAWLARQSWDETVSAMQDVVRASIGTHSRLAVAN